MSERSEAFMRLVVLVVSGIILSIWKTVVQIVVVIHWLIVFFTNKRNKDLAQFCNLWNTQHYRFTRYMTFATNDRPFPFTELGKVRDEVNMKK